MTSEQLDEKRTMDLFEAKRDLAVEEGKDRFVFYGADVLVSYAKYVIENYKNKGIK